MPASLSLVSPRDLLSEADYRYTLSWSEAQAAEKAAWIAVRQSWVKQKLVPTDQEWVNRIFSGELIVDRGQIDALSRKTLIKLVSVGKIARCRMYFLPSLLNADLYAAPNANWHYQQVPQFGYDVEAKPAFWTAVDTFHAGMVLAA